MRSLGGLGSLRGSPVDILKIDRIFVTGLERDERDTAIVRAVLALADALGLSTTAEGVETERQATALRALGCRRAQGYYFGRPLPAEAIDARLAGDGTVNPSIVRLAGPCCRVSLSRHERRHA